MTSGSEVPPIHRQLTPRELRAIWHRRRKAILVVFATVLGASLLLALLWPPSYESRATILIEQQEIPQDLVRTTVTGYADQRLQVINQRVISTQNLMQIAERFELYPRMRDFMAREEVVERVRSNIGFEIISADVMDQRRGVPTRAAIAFSVSFRDRSPSNAFRVANDLVSLYLDENLRDRSRLASETTEFLAEESRRLEREVAELERELAVFKQAHVKELPELLQVNWQLQTQGLAEVAELKRSIAAVDDRIIMLGARLKQIDPAAGYVTDSGVRIMRPSERLAALRAQLLQLRGRYRDDHPDMLRIEEEIRALEDANGAASASDDLRATLDALGTELAAIRERYRDDHPDVILLKNQILALSEGLTDVRTPGGGPEASNPSFVELQARLDSARLERRVLTERLADTESKLADYESRILASPVIEQEYRDIARRYQNTATKLAEINAKALEAQIAQSLEADRKAERLTLVDPPQIAELPVSPNRGLILLFGVVFALGLGAGVAAALESMDPRIFGTRAVVEIFGLAPLGTVPEILTTGELAQARSRPAYYGVGALLLLCVALLIVHFAVLPLDTLMYTLLNAWRS